ncbi:aldehyde dehydrogenase family protein, partial [Methylobacterium sp. WL18]
MSKELTMNAELRGTILIGAEDATTTDTFRAADAASGAALEPAFSAAGAAEVEAACALADAAFPSFSESTPAVRASFLDAVAEAVGDLGEALIARAMAETGLPRARL